VQMSRQLGCSASVVYKRLASENLHIRDKYTNLTDTQLDTYTEELHNSHNNAGNEVSLYCI